MKKPVLALVLLLIVAAPCQAQDCNVKIGETYYDLQSQGSGGNRLIKRQDGYMAATWAESCLPSQGLCPDCPYPTLGAGYNLFTTDWLLGQDGTCNEQGAANGVFTTRVSNPEIVVFPSGKEMIIADQLPGLISIVKPQMGIPGMSAWYTGALVSPATALGNTAPRAVASGSTLHLVASCDSCISAQGVKSPVRYYRSFDEGYSWSTVDFQLPDMDSTSFDAVGIHNYAIEARGNTVAIVAGSTDRNNQYAIWKSNDNGNSWTKTIIRSFSMPDTVTSVANPNVDAQALLATHGLYETNDRNHAILIDQNDKVHVWSGYMLMGIARDSSQQDVYFPLQSEGIWYWNENMAEPELIVQQREDRFPVGHPLNFVGNGTYKTPAVAAPYGVTGLLSMPTVAGDGMGHIYLIYSGIVEGTSNTGDATGQSYRNLYFMRLDVLNSYWTPPVNLPYILQGQHSEWEEGVFPSMAKTVWVDGVISLIYQADANPGLHLMHDFDAAGLNEIRAVNVAISSHYIFCLTPVAAADAQKNLQLVKAIPNPTSSGSNLQIELTDRAHVAIEVTNLLGQQILSLPLMQLEAGTKHQIALDLSGQPAGI